MKRIFLRLKQPLRNERGEITFFACFFVVGIVMLISFLLLYASIRITCINIRNGAKMELNNLSGTIYADTYRSQRETNFEEYLNTLYGTIKALRVYQRNVPYLPNTFRPAVIQYLQLCPFPKCPAQLIQVFDHAIFSFPRPTGQFCCAVCSPFLPAAYLPKFNSWTIR